MSTKNKKETIKKPITNDEEILDDKDKKSLILLGLGILLVIALIISIIVYFNLNRVEDKSEEKDYVKEVVKPKDEEVVVDEPVYYVNPVVVVNKPTITKYTVEYYNGNNLLTTTEVESGKNASRYDLTLEGTQILKYWYYLDSEGKEVIFNFEADTITSNLKLYAKIVNLYVVEFKNIDDTEIFSSQILEEGKTINQIPEEKLVFEIEEGIFKRVSGWYLDKEYTEVFNLETEVNSDLVLYAKYEDVFRVRFYSEELEDYTDYDGEYADKYVRENEKVTSLTDLVNEDKVVKDWYLLNLSTEPVTKELYNFDTLVNSNMILVPTFGYRLTYDTDGGSEIKAVVISEGDLLIKPLDPTKEGYIFDKWINETEIEVNFGVDTMIGNTTIKALWIAAIDFDSKGGTEVVSQIPNAEGKLEAIIVDPAREGYTFDGWYDNEEYTGYAIDLKNTKFETPEVLYAKWIAKDNTLTYNLNGGTNTDLEDEGSKKITVKSDEEIMLLDLSETYILDGSELIGWSDGKTIYELDSEYIMPPKDTVLYAVWQEIAV